MTGVHVDYVFKLCLIGDGFVGKTTLRQRYLGQNLSTDYLPTIGADFATKTITYWKDRGKMLRIKFQIRDLAGQAKFNEVRKFYYLGTHGFLAVFDITRPETLQNLTNWLLEAQKLLGVLPPFIVLGNKTDLRDEPNCTPLSPTAGEHFVQQHADLCPDITPVYLETSAKTGENVEKAFETITRLILEHMDI